MHSIIQIENDWYRLIPSRFPPVAVYAGLVAAEQFDALVAIENRTNPRLQSEQKLISAGATSSANSPRLQNWNLAPFAYRNPEGSRFFDQNQRVLELANTRQTALAVAVARREAFLSRTSEAPIGLDMRMLKRPVFGRFLDLRAYPPDLSQQERWKLGKTLSDELDGAHGVVYRPPERPSAICVAVLHGKVLGRAIQTEHYRFVWDGARISSLYAFDGNGQEIKPSDLSGEHDVVAA